MNQSQKQPDWSNRVWKEMLVYQRKMMWLDDTLDKLSAWMRVHHGMTAVDVGCGLGYLGYTFWKYFGQDGHYIGVDNTPELIRDATIASADWSADGEARFLVGDVYRLPLPDNCADWVMCQTLLMHLEKPEDALTEMVRVLKPGGLIMCNEPDNVNPALGRLFSSLPEKSIDEHFLCSKVLIICNHGRIKRGQGDNSIGPKVPNMFDKHGLIDIGVRINDRAHFLQPPYDDPLQQRALDHMKQQWLVDERYAVWIEREEDEFIAGGGDPSEYRRYRELMDEYRSHLRKQVDAGEYFACAAGAFYTIKARKSV